MQNIPWRSGQLAGILLCCVLLNSCGTVCIGPMCLNVNGRAGIPLLYADPGVRIERPPQGELAYEAGMALQSGDIVRTSAGEAIIDFDHDNIVALRNNTQIQLGSIKLFLGEVFARIGQIVQRGGGQVKTDEVSASVKGTEYSVRRSPLTGTEGRTAVIVRTGSVLCEDPGNRWTAVDVTANNIYLVEGRLIPRPPAYVNAQTETAWADDAIKRLLQPRQPQVEPGISIPVLIPGSPPAQRGNMPPGKR